MKHFLDVGANTGQTFGDFLLSRGEFDGATVWCFEPSPRHVQALMARVAEVRQRYAAVEVCAYGLGATTGEAVFYLKDDPRGDSFWAWTRTDHEPRNVATIRTACIGIVPWLQAHTAPADDVTLKLDCEGAEHGIMLALLNGPADALGRVREVLVEWHEVQGREREERRHITWRAEQAGIRVREWAA